MKRGLSTASGKSLAVLALPLLGGVASTTVEPQRFGEAVVMFSTVEISIITFDHLVPFAVVAHRGRGILRSKSGAISALSARGRTATGTGAVKEIVMTSLTSNTRIAQGDDVVGTIVILLGREHGQRDKSNKDLLNVRAVVK